MNTTNRFLTIGTLLCAFTLSALPLQARDGDDDDDHQEIDITVRLSPTANAPAAATGTAELEIGHSQPRTNKIEIHTSGLLPGIYTVTVFDRAGANATVLGTMAAGSDDDDDDLFDDHGGDRKHGEDGDSDDSGDDSGDDNGGRRGGGDDDDDGEAEFPVPAGINPFDIGGISITDSNGIEVLHGDFSDPTSAVSSRVIVRVPAVAGVADDDASGVAEIRGRARRGRSTGKFSLRAGNLPPNAAFLLVVNGDDAGAARTDHHGRLRVRRTHRNLDVLSIQDVSVRNEAGEEVLKAQF